MNGVGVVEFAKYLIQSRSIDQYDLQAYLQDRDSKPDSYDWSDVYMALWELRSGDRGRERALSILLHPILAASDNMPYVPVLLTTYDGKYVQAYIRPHQNYDLQRDVGNLGPYHGLNRDDKLAYAYDVRIKAQTYRFVFWWSFANCMRYGFSVRKVTGQVETYLPIYNLNDRLNAVAGYLYGIARWVHRSRFRLPGWDQPSPVTSATKRNNCEPEKKECLRATAPRHLQTKAQSTDNSQLPLPLRIPDQAYSMRLPGASSWLRKKLKTRSNRH